MATHSPHLAPLGDATQALQCSAASHDSALQPDHIYSHSFQSSRQSNKQESTILTLGFRPLRSHSLVASRATQVFPLLWVPVQGPCHEQASSVSSDPPLLPLWTSFYLSLSAGLPIAPSLAHCVSVFFSGSTASEASPFFQGQGIAGVPSGILQQIQTENINLSQLLLYLGLIFLPL